METELRHRGVPQSEEGIALSSKSDLLTTNADTKTTGPQVSTTRKPKHGRAMQFLRGVTLFLYFFVSCVA